MQLQPLGDRIAEEQDLRNRAMIDLLTRMHSSPGESLPLEQVQEPAIDAVFERLQSSKQRDIRSFSQSILQSEPLCDQQAGKRASGRSNSEQRSAGKTYRQRSFDLIVALVILTFLVGSMVVVLNQSKTISQSRPKPSHSFVPSRASTAIYVVRNEFIYKLAAENGRLLWKYKMDGPLAGTTTPLVTGGVVYVAHEKYFYALKAANGSLLWKTHLSDLVSDIQPVADGDAIYISLSQNQVYALDSTTGAIRWSHDLQGSIATMDAFNGVIYGMFFDGEAPTTTHALLSHGILFALDAMNGAQRWHAPVNGVAAANPYGTSGEMSVSGGMIYLTSSACATPPSSYRTCLYAFSAQNGTPLWHSTQLAPPQYYRLIVASGAVYLAGSSDAYALQTDDGTLLWHYKGNTLIDESMMVIHGAVLIVEANTQGDYLVTLNAADGHLQYRQVLNYVHSLGNIKVIHGTIFTQAEKDFVVDTDTIYSFSYAEDSVYALDNQSGMLLWQYKFPDATRIVIADFSMIKR